MPGRPRSGRTGGRRRARPAGAPGGRASTPPTVGEARWFGARRRRYAVPIPTVKRAVISCASPPSRGAAAPRGKRPITPERGFAMPTDRPATERIPGYCALCISRCGAIAVVEAGRLVALEPDPSHPTGQALCAKGRAAPELVYHRDRLLHPLKRTRPKGDPDPGWQRISWDEALDTTASRLRQIAERHGPESVVFSMVSASTSAIADSAPWVQRLMRAFGSPNFCGSMELCGWGRTYATRYTYGTGMGVAGAPMPDLEHASSVLLWGYNPSLARLSHATAILRAVRRGARLVVVDPRRAGLANKADVWLRVLPGTDGALALGLASAMIERGWYDAAFIRDWTSGPLLVREDDGRPLTERDLAPGGDPAKTVVWNRAASRPAVYDPARRSLDDPAADPALLGRYAV